MNSQAHFLQFEPPPSSTHCLDKLGKVWKRLNVDDRKKQIDDQQWCAVESVFPVCGDRNIKADHKQVNRSANVQHKPVMCH